MVLVGHSYGGLPVSTAALQVRDRIKTVVYVDSGPLPVGSSQMAVLGDQLRKQHPQKGPAVFEIGGA